MKKGRKVLGIVLVMMIVLVSFSGCASLFSPTTTQRQFASVTFENRTGVNVWYLYISERTDSSWGNDWLGEDVIMNGDSHTVRLLTGQYDVRLVDRNGANYSFWITVTSNNNLFIVRPDDKD